MRNTSMLILDVFPVACHVTTNLNKTVWYLIMACKCIVARAERHIVVGIVVGVFVHCQGSLKHRL